ncbi:hypothetical protein [Parafilimonas sp.]|uniref:hypothetical protein n=1 Tax=Parafilimonas sp. TaxID=1969739 RepID=UPI0039E23AA6
MATTEEANCTHSKNFHDYLSIICVNDAKDKNAILEDFLIPTKQVGIRFDFFF